jgi:hypothetical protein
MIDKVEWQRCDPIKLIITEMTYLARELRVLCRVAMVARVTAVTGSA